MKYCFTLQIASLFALALCAIPLVAQEHAPISVAPMVTAADLNVQPVGENWTSYNGDYTGQRFSRLQQINATNVSNLRAAWIFHPGNTQNLEVTPVVVGGLMYVTASNDVFALDAQTGREILLAQASVADYLTRLSALKDAPLPEDAPAGSTLEA